MQSIGQSHESSLHFSRQVFENEKTKHDPAKVKLAPYHPDTPIFRYTHARYLDRIQIIDGLLGNVVKQLTADGLLEQPKVRALADPVGVVQRATELDAVLLVKREASYRRLGLLHELMAEHNGCFSRP